jgi:hypothetical protein
VKDLEQVYDEQILPLMRQILDICKEHEMPMVASFNYQDEMLCTSAILPKESAPECLKRALRIIQGDDAGMIALAVTKSKEG